MEKITLASIITAKAKHYKKTAVACALFTFALVPLHGNAQETKLTVFDKILFYDGYAETVKTPIPPDGIIRNNNASYGKKLTTEQIATFGDQLTLNVVIKASCDNYDRIGNVNLAFVPKGATSYNYNAVKRIEIARYITPFMDKNKMPDEVPYTYDVSNLAQLFKDTKITNEYDFWVELEVFGVPYAANKEISGCDGRNDVFFGSLEFVSNTTKNTYGENLFQSIITLFNLKSYDANGTDEVGKTVKTVNFTVDKDIPNAKFYLITSNHGAQLSTSEEYNRRQHFVYLDGTQILTYKPGETTCEPYRKYNTQANGIYGSTVKSDANWQSRSNWCPGAKIPIRVIELGNLKAGAHSFKIEVPDAKFTGSGGKNDGMFPLSVYLQGYTTTLSTDTFDANNFSISPNPVKELAVINIKNNLEVSKVTITNITGQTVFEGTTKAIDFSALQSGMYMVKVVFSNDQVAVKKIIKN